MKSLIESPLFESLNGGILSAAILDGLIKGLILLALLGLIALGLRKASASARHGVWLAGLVGVLILPLLAVGLPGWNILPDAWSSAVEVPKTVASASPKPGGPVVENSGNVAVDPAVSPSVVELENPAPAAAPAISPAVIGAGKLGGDSEVLSTRRWIVLIWVVGAALLAARLSMSRWGVARLARRTRRVTGGFLEDELGELRARLGIRRRVVLLLSSQRAVPMTWGVFRPRILLPSEAANWKPEKRRAVLLHELAHVARWDCLSQLIGQATLMCHWFNPLVWVAVRRLAIEQEHACDDRVVGNGVDPPDYAELILNLSAAFPVPRWCGATATTMAKPAGLENRLRGILNPDRNRRSPGPGAVIAGIGCLALILCPLAMIEAGDRNKGKRSEPDGTGSVLIIDDVTESVEATVTSTFVTEAGATLSSTDGNVTEVGFDGNKRSYRVRLPKANILFANADGEKSHRIQLRDGDQGDIVFLTVDVEGKPVVIGGVVREDSDSVLVEDRRRSEGKAQLIRQLDQLRSQMAPHVRSSSGLMVELFDADGDDVGEVLGLLKKPEPQDGLDQLYREIAEELALTSMRLNQALAEAENERPRVLEDPGSAGDRKRLDAWRYRDYVTGARNADTPYDEFVAEQLAGDAESPESTADTSDRSDTSSGFIASRTDSVVAAPRALPVTELTTEDSLFVRDVARRAGEANLYKLSFPLAGIVREAPVKPGTEISKGKVLLQLDDRRAGNDLAIAKQQLDVAKANLDLKTVEYKGAQQRFEKLKTLQGQTSDYEIQESERKVTAAAATLKVAEAELAMAASQLSQAEITVQQHRILAPVDGRVVSIEHKPGEYAGAGSPAVVLRASPGKNGTKPAKKDSEGQAAKVSPSGTNLR